MKQKRIEPGILETLFGNSATARILDFISVHRDWDYNKHDIAENSNVSIRHTLTAIAKLEDLELIVHTRNVGRAQMYQYNTKNSAAQLLQKFALELAGQEAQKIAEQQSNSQQQGKK